MSKLLTFLGNITEEEAIKKLGEHLGPNKDAYGVDDRCEWGDANKNGGHLGAARRRIQVLETMPPAPPAEQPISVPVEPGFTKIQNGLTETFEINGTIYTKNYTILRE